MPMEESIKENTAKSTEAASKDEIEIEIKSSVQQRFSIDLTADELLREQRYPFFRQVSERNEHVWLISLFVIIHVAAFAATMFFNNCWQNSHGECALRELGRLSFQPLSENPLLGPSASGLNEAGALRQTFFTKNHQIWRLFSSPCLHGGVVHLTINLSSVIFVGTHLHQEFGALRTCIIYVLSALTGSLLAALFLEDRPSVASSGALFGLLGATLSGLIMNWKFYTKKLGTLLAFFFMLAINLMLGLLPYVNNFSNIGGFISGLLLGLILLFSPQRGKMAENNEELYDYGIKSSINLRPKLDRPVVRIIGLVLFSLLIVGLLVPVLHGINLNKYCSWCQYFDCVPYKYWSCNGKLPQCESMISTEQFTLTCEENGQFRVFPFTNVSQARIEDLCYLICS